MKTIPYKSEPPSTSVLTSRVFVMRFLPFAMRDICSHAAGALLSFQSGAALALGLLFACTARAGEVLPPFRLDNLFCTNVQVVLETPVEVLLKGEAFGFKRFNRQELPTELRDRFPYDPDKAADYAKQEAEKAKKESEQRRRDNYNALLRAEKEIQNKIEQKTEALVELQKKIKAWRSKPKYVTGRGLMLDKLIDQRIALEKQIVDLGKQLEGVQEQQKRWR